MKKYILLAAAAIAALSACNNEADEIINTPEIPAEEIPSVQAPVFTASIEGSGTRTAIDGNKVNWVSGDEVCMIFVGGSNGNDGFTAMSMVTYQATPSADDATKATLSIKEGETYDANANILMFAIYPASLFDLQKGGINFPATQVYAGEGQIPYAPMAVNNVEALRGEGEAIPSTLNFKNAGALLKITVPYSQMHSVSSITVSSNLAMNGAATIGGSGNLYIQEPETVTTENSKITLDCGTGVTIPEGSDKTFYVSILAPGAHFTCQYDYLQIDVTDGTTTKSMRTMKTGGIEIVTNKIYPINFAENYVASPITGTAKRTGDIDVNWVQLWNNGPKFAEYNVGAASNKPEDYGDYFAWGETEPFYAPGHAQDSPCSSWMEGKTGYNWTNYSLCEGTNKSMKKYCDNSTYGTVDSKTTLEAEDDAVKANWGSAWRMPTSAEMNALKNNCTSVWTDDYNETGIKGFIFTGKDAYEGNSIFLPAAGYRTESNLSFAGSRGFYWSSTLNSSLAYYANQLGYSSTGASVKDTIRYNGQSVRAVLAE